MCIIRNWHVINEYALSKYETYRTWSDFIKYNNKVNSKQNACFFLYAFSFNVVIMHIRITFQDIVMDKEKKEEIWLSPMTKAPSPAEMSKGQSDVTNNATKSSIAQRLRTDLGRSVGVG